jgi:hypothetical protein
MAGPFVSMYSPFQTVRGGARRPRSFGRYPGGDYFRGLAQKPAGSYGGPYYRPGAYQAPAGAGPNLPATPPPPADQPAAKQDPYAAVDYSADPILARIRALNAEDVAAAEAEGAAARKQLLIGFGDPTFAAGVGGDQQTQDAARTNPFSTVAKLTFAHGQQNRSIDEGSNKANLFYSGERVRQLGLEDRNFLEHRTDAQSAVNSALGEIASRIAAAKRAAQERELGGLMGAFDTTAQGVENGTTAGPTAPAGASPDMYGLQRLAQSSSPLDQFVASGQLPPGFHIPTGGSRRPKARPRRRIGGPFDHFYTNP